MTAISMSEHFHGNSPQPILSLPTEIQNKRLKCLTNAIGLKDFRAGPTLTLFFLAQL